VRLIRRLNDAVGDEFSDKRNIAAKTVANAITWQSFTAAIFNLMHRQKTLFLACLWLINVRFQATIPECRKKRNEREKEETEKKASDL
jgi:hypothetical protein